MNEVELGIVVWLLLLAWGAVSILLTTATRGEKLFWLAVLSVPLAGFLAWYVFGPHGEVMSLRKGPIGTR